MDASHGLVCGNLVDLPKAIPNVLTNAFHKVLVWYAPEGDENLKAFLEREVRRGGLVGRSGAGTLRKLGRDALYGLIDATKRSIEVRPNLCAFCFLLAGYEIFEEARIALFSPSAKVDDAVRRFHQTITAVSATSSKACAGRTYVMSTARLLCRVVRAIESRDTLARAALVTKPARRL